MSLGMDYEVGLDQGHMGTKLPQKGAQPPIFGPFVTKRLDANWYGGIGLGQGFM